MAIDFVDPSGVLNKRPAACVCQLRTDDKYEQNMPFLHALFSQNAHRSSVFLLEQSVLILQYMVWVYGTTAAASQKGIVTEVVVVWDKALQLNDGLLALPFYVLCRTEFMKQVHTVLEGFAESCEYHQGCSVPQISQTYLAPQA